MTKTKTDTKNKDKKKSSPKQPSLQKIKENCHHYKKEKHLWNNESTGPCHFIYSGEPCTLCPNWKSFTLRGFTSWYDLMKKHKQFKVLFAKKTIMGRDISQSQFKTGK